MVECNPAKLRLFVKSQTVPAGLTQFSRATATGPWTVSQSPVRAVVYEHVLDDSQAGLVAEARRLSNSSGLDLEVVDLGRMGVLQRIFWSRFIGPGPVATSTGLGMNLEASPPGRALS